VKSVGPARAVADALDWARGAGTGKGLTLLYNDFNTGEEHVALLAQLRKWGKLPDAVGIQSHMHRANWPREQVWMTADRFARFGKPVHFTEVSVLSGPGRANVNMQGPAATDWLSTPEGEAEQARYLEDFYSVLFSHPAVRAITYWDSATGGRGSARRWGCSAGT
jgi:endo-1,4-beta-xylanase